MTSDRRKTHAEYMAMAVVLGQHIGVDGDPLQKAIHFLTSQPKCPLCLEEFSKVQDTTQGSGDAK